MRCARHDTDDRRDFESQLDVAEANFILACGERGRHARRYQFIAVCVARRVILDEFTFRTNCQNLTLHGHTARSAGRFHTARSVALLQSGKNNNRSGTKFLAHHDGPTRAQIGVIRIANADVPLIRIELGG